MTSSTRTALGTPTMRRVLVLVFALGTLHAAAYAVLLPPWAVEDEQQHVDYVWRIAFDHRLPSIEEPIDEEIVRAVWSGDRWEAYGMQAPAEPTAEAFGLQGRSYMAYHPPLAYLLSTPVALLTGEQARLLLAGLRALDALVAGAACATAAALGVRLVRLRAGPSTHEVDGAPPRDHDRASEHRRALAIGLAVAALPGLAESGGRVDTDVWAALAVLVVLLLLVRWWEAPSSARAWTVGAGLVAAVLARETTVVLVVPVVVAALAAWRRGQWSRTDPLRMVAPPVAAWAAWGLLFGDSGFLLGSSAFTARYGLQFAPMPPGDVLHALVHDSLVTYGSWHLPPLVLLAPVVALVGLVLAARRGWPVLALTAAGMLAVAVAIDVQLARIGHSPITTRLLLPAYAPVVIVATLGWSSLRRRGLAYVPALVTGSVAIWFLAARLVPAHGLSGW